MWSRREASETHFSPRDTQEAYRHEHSSDGDLIITKLDAIEVLDTQAVRLDQAVQGQNFIHLYRRDQSTASLPDDMRD
jgi:hypothetical protein